MREKKGQRAPDDVKEGKKRQEKDNNNNESSYKREEARKCHQKKVSSRTKVSVGIRTKKKGTELGRGGETEKRLDRSKVFGVRGSVATLKIVIERKAVWPFEGGKKKVYEWPFKECEKRLG